MIDGGFPVYEARYRLDGRGAFSLVCVAALCLYLLQPAMPLYIGLPCAAFFGGTGLSMAYTVMSRRVALRVDRTGVLLAGSLVRYRSTTFHVPWEHIDSVVIWGEHRPLLRGKYWNITTLCVGLGLHAPSRQPGADLGPFDPGKSPHLVPDGPDIARPRSSTTTPS